MRKAIGKRRRVRIRKIESSKGYEGDGEESQAEISDMECLVRMLPRIYIARATRNDKEDGENDADFKATRSSNKNTTTTTNKSKHNTDI